jgi:hypothetical protein
MSTTKEQLNKYAELIRPEQYQEIVLTHLEFQSYAKDYYAKFFNSDANELAKFKNIVENAPSDTNAFYNEILAFSPELCNHLIAKIEMKLLDPEVTKSRAELRDDSPMNFYRYILSATLSKEDNLKKVVRKVRTSAIESTDDSTDLTDLLYDML